jgi:hypothetical protein
MIAERPFLGAIDLFGGLAPNLCKGTPMRRRSVLSGDMPEAYRIGGLAAWLAEQGAKKLAGGDLSTGRLK